jgi:crotonobetaine/carnitine-CoA ligase
VLRLAPAERTLPALLERRAVDDGARPFLTAPGGERSFAELRDAAARGAGALAAAGVTRGDRVAALAGNRLDLIELWLACAWAGAVLVPVNTALRGAQLAHVLTMAEPRLLVLEAGLARALAALDVPPAGLEGVWLLDGDAALPRGWPTAGAPAPGVPAAPAAVAPCDPTLILFTSGTTGPAKGVVCPHAQLYWWGVNTAAVLEVGTDDVLATCLPLFHTNALNTVVQGFVTGARVVVRPRFSASGFWRSLAEDGATVTYILGAIASILASRPASADDRAHSVRVALAPATPAALWPVFAERFGIRLVEGHGMTETNLAIGPLGGEQRPGWMGRPLPGFAARVVDEAGDDVPTGTAGQLLVRADDPLAFAAGYWRLPEETARAWHDGWFRTGDRAVRDDDGWIRFVDRLKDAIRRRGENVSAWEVEQVLAAHPAVAEAAVVPVPSELGEDEVLAFVVPAPGAHVDPVELVRSCEGRLAYFAIPRYVEVLPELPLTENGKVQKFALRERGVGEATWDREAARVEIRRD